MMMKKLISLLCVLTMVIGIIAVSAVSTSAAVDSAKTQIEVKNGQDVTYRLKLSEVESKVVGTEFSVYYDSSVLEPVSVLDFNDNDEENWNGNWLANYKKDGEVLCNFSVVRGVEFKEPRSVITINFKAKANATTDITYFVRYLYDYRPFTEEAMKNKSQPQITEFKYTCDVTVDGDPIIEDAQPELNVDVPQDKGSFINSVTGDSKDTDVDLPGVSGNKDRAATAYEAAKSMGYNAEEEEFILYDGKAPEDDAADNGSAQSANANQSGGSDSGNGSAAANQAATTAATSAPAATTAEGYYVKATDAQGNVTATSDEAPVVTTGANNNKGGSSPVIWIIIALVVLAGGGAGVYFYMKKKKAAPSAEASATPENKE